MSSITNPLGTTPTSPAKPAATTPAASSASQGDALANESTFLKLLVSQLQNQDPLNPTDSNQFVSQLTAYSQLEQLISINKNTAGANATTTSTTPAAPAPAAPTPAAPALAGITNNNSIPAIGS